MLPSTYGRAWVDGDQEDCTCMHEKSDDLWDSASRNLWMTSHRRNCELSDSPLHVLCRTCWVVLSIRSWYSKASLFKTWRNSWETVVWRLSYQYIYVAETGVGAAVSHLHNIPWNGRRIDMFFKCFGYDHAYPCRHNFIWTCLAIIAILRDQVEGPF